MSRYGTALPFLVGAFLLLALPAYAQFNTGDAISLDISPQNPHPYDTVTITPSSTSIDLAASAIAISLNGKVVANTTGGQSVPIVVGGPGEKTDISVSATTGGKTYTTDVILRPADVALVVEPLSTTHPFYLGAPLVATSGRVHIVAIPDLRTSPQVRLPASKLIYTWKLGDQVLEAQSGIGRSFLNAEATVQYRDANVSVTVTDPDSTLVAESTVNISPTDPIVRIYHEDPLMGPDFDTALTDSFSMRGEEDAFRAVSYFFRAQPSLSWSVNGQDVSSDKDVTVRATGTGQGDANLSVEADDSNTSQSASSQVSISFGAKRTNIFGF